MQILDLIIDKCYQRIDLLIENILQNFPAKMGQFGFRTARQLILRSNPDLRIDHICLRNILSRCKVWHVQ